MSEALTAELSGAQKAAILLLKLGQNHSSKVLKLLGDAEVTQITAEIVKAQTIRKEDSDLALTEFAALVVARSEEHTSELQSQ